MRDLAWRIIAFIVTRPAVTAWLIRRAQRTPYEDILGPDGSVYMARWWLFNPYAAQSDGEGKRWRWLPSVRIHHIRREDTDRHLHDHPWNARTIILRGFYFEERQTDYEPDDVFGIAVGRIEAREVFKREKGYTGRLLYGQYHRINEVAADGAWTLFITWRSRGTWGFDVDGIKVPWRTYLGIDN